MTFRISLPWPDSRLNPNRRTKWRPNADIRRAKEEAYLLTKAKIWTRYNPLSGDLELKTTIYPPDRRKRDQDNTYASLKAARDGMFQALEIDDRCVKRTVIEWGEVKKGGEIVMELEEI